MEKLATGICERSIMVKIVTGKINSHKTERMRALFESNHKGDGFISLKMMLKNKVHSYQALRLSTGDKFPLVVRDEFVYEDFPISCQIGPYLFNKRTIDMIIMELSLLIKKRIAPLYLDEVGLLEIEGKCFDPIVRKMVDSNLDCVFSVRQDLVDKFIQKYNIRDYDILR